MKRHTCEGCGEPLVSSWAHLCEDCEHLMALAREMVRNQKDEYDA